MNRVWSVLLFIRGSFSTVPACRTKSTCYCTRCVCANVPYYVRHYPRCRASTTCFDWSVLILVRHSLSLTVLFSSVCVVRVLVYSKYCACTYCSVCVECVCRGRGCSEYRTCDLGAVGSMHYAKRGEPIPICLLEYMNLINCLQLICI
jgi:hypothetical protein